MRFFKIIIPIAVIALAGWLAVRSAGGLRVRQVIPTAVVRRGDLKVNVETTGTLATLQTFTLFAPVAGGGTLAITHLDSDGTAVTQGSVVLQFDPGEQEYNLETSRSDLEQADQAMKQARAQTAVQNADDRLALLNAKFAVQQAQLEVQENPILAAIDAKKNILALKEAQRTYAQLQQDIQSHAQSNRADLLVAQAQYQKASIGMARAQQNIRNMTLRSPVAGVVEVLRNFGAIEVTFPGMTIPEFRDGDQVQPGSPIAEILDMTHMVITARIREGERPLVHVGEPVTIRMDAIPNAIFHGRVATLSGMALSNSSMWSAVRTRMFDITINLDRGDPRFRPGFTAHVTLDGSPLTHVLYVPRVAIFEKDEEPIVYLKRFSGFAAKRVKLETETSSWAVIEGVAPGARVALVNPSAESEIGAGSQAASSVPGAMK